TRVERRIRELRGAGPAPGLLIVGPVRVDEAAGPRREALDRMMAEIARHHDGVYHLDPVSEGPLEPGAPALTSDGGLTWQGHARVAAAVCDAILGHWPASG